MFRSTLSLSLFRFNRSRLSLSGLLVRFSHLPGLGVHGSLLGEIGSCQRGGGDRPHSLALLGVFVEGDQCRQPAAGRRTRKLGGTAERSSGGTGSLSFSFSFRSADTLPDNTHTHTAALGTFFLEGFLCALFQHVCGFYTSGQVVS